MSIAVGEHVVTTKPGVSVQWHGHATTTIVDSGTRVLTDPVLTNRVGHLRRRRGPRPGDAVYSPDVVVLSHLHSDHTHIPSLQLLDPGVPIIVPAGAVGAVRGLRAFSDQIIEASIGDTIRIGALSIDVTPAEHDGRRWPRGPAQADAVGYLIRGSATTYFAGDTDLYREMDQWAANCDMALIPVGGWGPTLGPGHLTPQRAAEAVAHIGAGHAVPIHFGTLWPIGLDKVRPERFHAPGADFVTHAARAGVAATELEPGTTVSWGASA
ncbi:MBL fold metallo-hydrolase [Hoyosella subflava]|uniref:MBL fold metallo-hydrolase n=1 Tax=Hoyosella subflava TaxID=639313 RepID=UPI001ED95C7F|nr:MBL fold metallo-hydrolase [Hoyosella subflava]